MTARATYDEAGEGPAVLLVHAGIADRRMWRSYLPWLAAQGRHAIAPDLPGFGDHPPTADPPAPWDYLREVLDELAVDRAVVVGCSFGGAVALRLMVTAPERIRGLAVISAPAPGLEPSAPLTELGRPAVRAYAARSGRSEEQYAARFGAPLTPEIAGASVVELVRADAATVAPGYLLTGAGLEPLA